MTRPRTPERAEFLTDVITTALEGGIGYWAVASSYRWYHPTLDGGTATPGPNGTANAYATIHETEGDDAIGPPLLVDVDAIARALGIMRKGTPEGWNARDVARCLAASAANDAGDIDSGDADCIVQIAVLGSVVYG
jgi:hypothetical protein